MLLCKMVLGTCSFIWQGTYLDQETAKGTFRSSSQAATVPAPRQSIQSRGAKTSKVARGQVFINFSSFAKVCRALRNYKHKLLLIKPEMNTCNWRFMFIVQKCIFRSIFVNISNKILLISARAEEALQAFPAVLGFT